MAASCARERPLLFSAPMVRAILEGRKTQTRRVVKPQPEYKSVGAAFASWVFKGGLLYPNAREEVLALCPYGQPGDQLWVRETTIITPKHWNDGADYTHIDSDGDKRIVKYLATSPNREAADDYKLKATPSIFMPRWASRITLDLTVVRVERLNKISDADCLAEGVDPLPRNCLVSIQASYAAIWEAINGPGSWDRNPWVWVLDFAVVAPTTGAAS